MKRVQFEIEQADIVREDQNSSFSTAKILAFSSGPNRNHIECSPDILQKTAPTIYEKPILYNVSRSFDDLASHANRGDSLIAGFVVPNSAEFVTLPDGRMGLSVMAKLWKKYAPKVIEYFRRDPDSKKKASVELELSEYTQRKDGRIDMLDFVYEGICLLGDHITEGSPGASAQVTSFAEENEAYFEAVRKEFSNNEGLMVSMPKKTNENMNPDSPEAEVPVVPTIEQPQAAFEEERPPEETPPEDGKDSPESEEEPEEDEEEEMGCGKDKDMEFELDFSAVLKLFPEDGEAYQTVFAESQKENFERDYGKVFETLCADLTAKANLLMEQATQLAALQGEKEQFSAQIAELTAFKNEKETKEKDVLVETALGQVKEYFSEEEMDAFRQDAAKYGLSDLEDWQTKVMAKAFAMVQKSQSKPQETEPEVITRFDVPNLGERDQTKPRSIWDQLKN